MISYDPHQIWDISNNLKKLQELIDISHLGFSNRVIIEQKIDDIKDIIDLGLIESGYKLDIGGEKMEKCKGGKKKGRK